MGDNIDCEGNIKGIPELSDASETVYVLLVRFSSAKDVPAWTSFSQKLKWKFLSSF